MAETEAVAGCPLGKMINDAGNDEAAALDGEEVIRTLKANMRGCLFLTMVKGIRVLDHQGKLVVEIIL